MVLKYINIFILSLVKKILILTNTGKHVPSSSSSTEGYIIHLFVVCNKLSLHMAWYNINTTKYLSSLQNNIFMRFLCL